MSRGWGPHQRGPEIGAYGAKDWATPVAFESEAENQATPPAREKPSPFLLRLKLLASPSKQGADVTAGQE
jgi:hypothetical protein